MSARDDRKRRFDESAGSADKNWQKRLFLSDAFTAMSKLVEETCPAGRERALVLTKLDEANMWAARAVVGGAAGDSDEDYDQLKSDFFANF